MKKAVLAIAMCLLGTTAFAQQSEAVSDKQPAKVYFTRDISSKGLMKIYKALGVKVKGKNVAVKLSTGEPGGHNFLNAQMIAPLVKKVKGTIVECNTAYGGRRRNTESHYKVAEEHGFTAIAKVDIMDGPGEEVIPVKNGKHLQGKNYVGKNLLNYDYCVVLSHFKGHEMGGFGGALKNISIGIASSHGKSWIHSSGNMQRAKQEDFIESMGEAATAVVDHFGGNMLFVSVANNLSVDCDCSSHPAAPQMADIGIFASVDPVAIDQACVDMVYASDDPGKVHLIERMESRKGPHILKYTEGLGGGTTNYQLIDIDK